MADKELTLIFPEQLSTLFEQQIKTSSFAPTLSKLMKRGQTTMPLVRLERLLFDMFANEASTDSDLPTASIRRPNKIAVCADPCHLYPDRDRLVLVNDDLSLTDAEADTIIETLQPLFAEFGANLIKDTPLSWTLEFEQKPDVKFTALPDISGLPVTNHLPTGDSQEQWRRLWNEVQMVLYSLPLNNDREMAGKSTINGVWFWGAAELKVTPAKWQSATGNSALLKQLAQLADTEYSSHPDNFTDWLKERGAGQHLYLLTMPQQELDWQQLLIQWEIAVLQPIWRALRWHDISTVKLLFPGYGQVSVNTVDCWKLW